MKDLKKKLGIFSSALLLSIICSIAVFAVADYDSSADPLISRSYLIKYINETVVAPQESKLAAIESKLLALEEALNELIASPPSSGGSTETGTPDTGSSGSSDSTLNSILRLTERIEAIEKKMTELNSANASLGEKYDSMKKENDKLKAELESIKDQISDYVTESGKEDVDELKEKLNSLSSELASLKNSTSSIQSSFTDISKSYVTLQKEVYNLNQTLKELSDSDSSVLADLLNLSGKVNEFGAQLNELMTKNMSFELVKLEKGDSIVANGSVSVMLQYGEAKASSPKSAAGTSMEYTDLTSGEMIYDGDILPLNHNIFIPGNGRTAILCTGEHGIYIFVGGDYTIVKAETDPSEGGGTNAEGGDVPNAQ